jgi:hypothetical protein
MHVSRVKLYRARERARHEEGTMRTHTTITVAVLAATVLTFGCKGKMDAAQSSAGGAGGQYQLLVEQGRPDPQCVSGVIETTTYDYDLAEDVALTCKRFSPPGVLATLSNEDTAYTIEEELEAKCSIQVEVIEGEIEWKLSVRQEGPTDCMTSVLSKLVSGTQSSDWEGRVSAGQVVHTSNSYKAIRKMEYRLEKKCGCKLDKTPVYD